MNTSPFIQGGRGQFFVAPPSLVPFAHVWGDDGIAVRYRFEVYAIEACPPNVHAVYVFAALAGGTYVSLYIGRADILSQRLSSHERRAEAIRRGATHLLVHTPAAGDRIAYDEAERRLIRHYAPPMNEQFNPLASIRARLSGVRAHETSEAG